MTGFAGWFTVDFNGSVETPATRRVTLSTGPEAGYTHWGQQVLYDTKNHQHWNVKYSTIQYSTVQYITLQDNTVRTVQDDTIQYDTGLNLQY